MNIFSKQFSYFLHLLFAFTKVLVFIAIKIKEIKQQKTRNNLIFFFSRYIRNEIPLFLKTCDLNASLNREREVILFVIGKEYDRHEVSSI